MLVCHQPLSHLSVAIDRPIVGVFTSNFIFQVLGSSVLPVRDFDLDNQNLFSRRAWVYFELHMPR